MGTTRLTRSVPGNAGGVLARLPGIAVVIFSLLPLALDARAFAHHELGAEPYKALIRDTGVWSLWFLGFTLAVTPMRRLGGLRALAPFRRTLGLISFFYATVHTVAYLVFDRLAGVDFTAGALAALSAFAVSTLRDIWSKPFLLIGTIAFVVMVPLAVTSTSAMTRRLGGRRWRLLHRLVYAVGVASLLHHWWPLADRFDPLDRFSVLILSSLALRAGWAWTRTQHAGLADAPAERVLQ